MDQEIVWDLLAGYWKEYRTRIKEDIKDFLHHVSGKLLDLGCGSGRNFLTKKNLTIYGVDFSLEMINYAKEHIKKKKFNAQVKKVESHKTGYANEFFDAILCNALLQCVETKEKKEKTIKEIYRVLKPGGKVFLSTWGPKSPRLKGKKGKVYVPWTVRGEKLPRYTYIYSKKELRDLVEKSGFVVKKEWEDWNINFILRKPVS